MMQIVYSTIKKNSVPIPSKGAGQENEIENLRLQAYQTVCEKYASEIKAIQRHMPGWQPAFILK